MVFIEEFRKLKISVNVKHIIRHTTFFTKVSQYLRNTLAGTSVFLGFQSMHSQYLQFNFMLSISKCSCSVFQNVHAVYLGFENTVSFSVCALS